MKKLSLAVLSAVVCSLLLSFATSAEAKGLLSKLNAAPKPAKEVASPSDAPLPVPVPVPMATPAPVPVPLAASSDSAQCQNRCIKYRHHCTLRKTCCGCCEDIKMVLSVKDPCCCCNVDVSVCVPGCCKDVPSVCNHNGVFGRNVVEYTWCCGYRVKVVFDRCGDVTVHTYGR